VKALTLWQPWASLCVLPRMLEGGTATATGPFRVFNAGPFKTIETRSWPAPKALIGQRIAIHAAQRPVPGVDQLGESDYWYDAFGMWTETKSMDGRNVITDPWPLGAVVGTAVLTDCVPIYHIGQLIGGSGGALWPNIQINGRDLATLTDGKDRHDDVSDQRPFGDFAPGRWAWLLADAEQCEPIPATGRQGIWNWDE